VTPVSKRKFRWLFKIEGVSAQGVNALPPTKGARPNLSFKEMDAQHISETVYFPGKPEWKPVTLSLYDLKKDKHPVFEWIKQLYNPQTGKYIPSCERIGQTTDSFKKDRATLELYDGCGDVLETWVFENVWVQAAEFGELDMGNSEVLTCDLTLRYDRAYIDDGTGDGGGDAQQTIRDQSF
jgi:hypothetical protein